MTPQLLSPDSARRVALAAQCLPGRRTDRVQRPQALRVATRLAQIQLDSVSVLTRAQRMPLFSRLGGYDPQLLVALASGRRRRLFEYWGHAACLIDVDLEPALRFRMAAAQREAWGSVRRVQRESPEAVAQTLAVIEGRGASTAREVMGLVSDAGAVHENWGWNWSVTKTALEWLFWSGALAVAGRTTQFERVYDLPERVLPTRVLAAETPSPGDSHIILVRRAAQALGVASRRCLRDYFRTAAVPTDRAIDALVEEGELVPVTVPGWTSTAFLWHGARIPASLDASCLVSPFDSLIFERRRALDLFGLDYRIEIYVPAARRRHGYYVYPFLLGDSFAARVDLRADRARRRLEVRASWREPDHPRADPEVAAALAAELRRLADWLGLDDIEVAPRGDFAGPTAAALGRQLHPHGTRA
ncbi:MAG: crosslink repair DNA glycosylase YcaQ family protein [Propionibacterium sp.]